MAADAERGLGGEPLFAGLAAADIAEKPPAMVEDCVRNDLFVRGIVFGVVAGKKIIVRGIEERRQIAINFEREPLEGTEGIEQRAPDNEDVFVGILGRHGRLRLPQSRDASTRNGEILSARQETAGSAPGAPHSS